MDAAALVASRLVGHGLTAVESSDYDWLFRFADGAALRVWCAWRVIAGGRLAHGDCDHGQQFGLSRPVDGVERSSAVLLGKTIQTVTIRDDTGDLTIAFEDRTTLEILNTSSGYEGWQFWDQTRLRVVAMGGGELAIWDEMLRTLGVSPPAPDPTAS